MSRRQPNARQIFVHTQLRATQLRTVADRRLGDSIALQRTGENARANGAMYLAGFVVECLLKAALLERHPWLQSVGSPDGRSKQDQRLWALCYQRHDLEKLLALLPDITRRMDQLERRTAARLAQSLKSICAWTIFARYSPQNATIAEAVEFIGQIEELKPWLK